MQRYIRQNGRKKSLIRELEDMANDLAQLHRKYRELFLNEEEDEGSRRASTDNSTTETDDCWGGIGGKILSIHFSVQIRMRLATATSDNGTRAVQYN